MTLQSTVAEIVGSKQVSEDFALNFAKNNFPEIIMFIRHDFKIRELKKQIKKQNS